MKIKPSYLLFVLLFGLFTSKKVNSQVLNHETTISINRDGEKTTVKTFLIQVNEKKDNWLSQIKIRHNSQQDFSVEFARVKDSNGNFIRKIKKKNITTRNVLSYDTFYQDDLITEFDLYYNLYPYQIEYSYRTVENEFLYIAFWTPIIYTSVKTLKSSLKLEVPIDYPVQISQSENIQFNEYNYEGIRKLNWQIGINEVQKKEVLSPPLSELIQTILIVPTNFNYGVKGSFSSWSSFGSWQANLNNGTDLLPNSERLIVNQLIQGITDKKEIIKKIYYYLQDHTDYINISIDEGGLKSYPASYVCKNKFGDCKALTTYMKAMLKSVGIESYYTLINSGANEAKIKEDFPSQQFNHVILTIPIEKDTLWLENTSKSIPFNYLGTFSQDRLALVIKNEKSELIQIPKLQINEVKEEKKYTFTYDKNNNWKSNIQLELRGETFEEIRTYISNKNEEALGEYISNIIGLNSFELVEWSFIDNDRTKKSIQLKVIGNCPSQIRKIGKLLVINPLHIMPPNFEKPNERKQDVRLNFPINKLNKIIYQIPETSDLAIQIPDKISLNSNYGKYTVEYLVKNNSIEVVEHLILYSGDITLKKYPLLFSFIKSIKDYKRKSAILIQ